MIRAILTTTICYIVLGLSLSNASGGEHVSPVALRCEYLVNPEGMEVLSPRLSWEICGKPEGGNLKAERGVRQTAYRVLVASSRELLKKNQGDLWDTGKVMSDQSNQLAYAGKPLSSRMPCFWKVMVWPALSGVEGDVAGTPSAWSAPAYWSMGLLDAADWKAEWIGLDKAPENKPEQSAALEGANETIVIQKAIYGVLHNPSMLVDVTEILQKRVDAGNRLVIPTNDLAGKDPAPGRKKKLLVECLVGGRHVKGTVPENIELDISTGGIRKQYLPAPYLRKEFNVSAPVKRAVIYVTAQGFFELHLNGKMVSDEFFMPGWTDYRKRIYYRSYDVTDMLNQGPNAIGAILGDGWFRGNISNLGQNQYGKLIRLMSQLHIDYADGRS